MGLSRRRIFPAQVCAAAAGLVMMLIAPSAQAKVVIEYLEYGAKAQAAIQLNQDLAAKIDAALKQPCIDKTAFDDLSNDVIQAANAGHELARTTDTEVDTSAVQEEGIPVDHGRLDRYRTDLSNTGQANTDRLDVLKEHICRDHSIGDHPPANPTPVETTAATAPRDSGAPNTVGDICHHCEWIRIQIGDIDDKIASWQRQIESINKNSDLSDPKIQNALKDLADKITALKAKKADLQTQLADCEKRCADAKKKAALKPVAPVVPGGATETGGSGANGVGGTAAADDATPAQRMPRLVMPPFICPPDAPKVTPVRQDAVVPGLPPSMPLPPAPTNKDDKQDWDDLLNAMLFTELAGDMDDVFDVARDLDEAIESANNDLAFDPQDYDARERLEWLEVQKEYYESWKAYIRVKYPRLEIVPADIRKCYVDPEWIIVPREPVNPPREHSSGDHDSPLNHFRFGVGFGFGGDDRKDGGDHKVKPPKDDGDSKFKPLTDDKPRD